MPPRNVDVVSFNDELDIKSEVAPVVTPNTHGQKRFRVQIVWRNVVGMLILHLMGLYGFIVIPSAHPLTWLWACVVYLVGALGITAGAHRLWAHRSYKAKMPLRIVLAIFQCIAFQNDILEWSRDHRVHHKFSETDADPHNAKRGFFFAHVGWLLVKKHPDVKTKGKTVDISDLYGDPVVTFQRRFYLPGMLFFCFLMPTFVPWYFWGESFSTAYFVNILRLILSLNVTWCVNSIAHMWGNKPYDRNINPVENFYVTFGAVGEGYHNYHHTFPQDYSTSEYGWRVNMTTLFIDTMAFLGLSYDRKKTPCELVARRKERTGDGTSGFGYFQTPKEKTT